MSDMFLYRLGQKRGGGGASSWNDLADRPFYKESGEKVIIKEETFVSTSETYDDGWVDHHKHYLADDSFLAAMDNYYDLAGSTVTVTFDGVDYDCEVKEGGSGGINIGGFGEWEEVQHPFVINYRPEDGMELAIKCAVDGTHTCSVKAKTETVVTIPAEYLPKAEAVDNVWATDYPTAEEFNALLQSLRDAGYLAE